MKKSFLFGSLAMLASALCMQQPLSSEPTHYHKKQKKWDYVIVGGGTAACELANILTADLKTSVLMIEAGPNYDNDLRVETPAPYANQLANQYSALYDWQQVSVPQQYVTNSSGAPATFPYVNGRLLGGGSSHNGLQYVRPTNNFLNEWAALSGSPLWGPASVNAAFTLLENYNGTTNSTPTDIRGTSGPIQVRQAPITADIQPPALTIQSIIAGTAGANSLPVAQRLVPYPNDYNDPTIPIGVCPQWQLFEAWMPSSPPNERQSSSIIFIEPIINAATGKGINGRKLQVITNATVSKILFRGKTATGVAYSDPKGFTQCVYAQKEVIVSAGAFSPEVLMRSGIGNYTDPSDYTNPVQAPWALLSASDIPMVYNNPSVGQNLKNHPLMFMAFMIAPADVLPITDINALYITPAFFPDPSNIAAGQRVVSFDVAVGGNSPSAATANEVAILTQLLTPTSVGSVVIRSQNTNTCSLEDPNLFGDNGGGTNSHDYQILYNFFQGVSAPGVISPLNGPGYNIIIGLQNEGWILASPARSTYETEPL